MPSMSPRLLQKSLSALLFAGLSVTLVAPATAQGSALPLDLSQIKLHRIVAPHRTGADLLKKLQLTAAGQQSLAAAGMTTELASRIFHTVAPQTAGDGWPATFDLTIDGSSLYVSQTVGSHSVTLGFMHDGQVVTGLAPPTMLVGLVPAAKSRTLLDASQLPAGLYLIAFDFGADATTGASISTVFSFHPPSPPPTVCAPATLAQTADPQTGIGTCIAVVRIAQPDKLSMWLRITSSNASLGYANFAGATISRISP